MVDQGAGNQSAPMSIQTSSIVTRRGTCSVALARSIKEPVNEKRIIFNSKITSQKTFLWS